MGGIVEDVATHVAESLADKATQELKYLCCYKSYVDDFEEEKASLSARSDSVRENIQEAKDRNENQINSEVELWLRKADALVNEDTKGKKKWFGLVPNCFWQYNRAKDLEDKKQRIQKLVEQSNNFTRFARSTGLPGIEFYSIENFMQLKDRKLQFGKLTEALKNDKKFVIGLYGLGGTGKTAMAIEVGKEVAESKVFDKVIFSVVSKDPNLKKIRDNIAKHLNLTLEEGEDESEQAQKLWKRIAEGGEKVLLILDDVWEKLSLQHIGIPLGRHGKSCCSILLTARGWKVCRDMGCHETIKLEVLNEQDAVDLFLSYASQSIDDSSNDFKDVALDIVKECGRLPVAIVAVARALKSKPLKEWKQGLERLRNPKSIHDVNEDLKEAYNSLRLSYDYLENKEAQQLFLLCSLFPDDYEIPIELLTRIAIGMELCGGANKYFVARSYFTPIKNVLMDSCLLLKAENEAVKMHDLVQEVALWIGNKLVQVVMDPSKTLMKNIQYSSWKINGFPSHFDGRKLEVLLLWISNAVKVPNGIFEGMEKLKILALMNGSNIRISGASLFQSHPSLINVRSLAIKNFELGDISFLINLKSLESLELSECSMIELPKELRELEKLRLLEIVESTIERNNPFEMIGSYLQLEELYFVSNHTYESLAQITTFPQLERYQIKAWPVFSYYKVDFSISRYFDSKNLRVNFSNEIFKSLVERAEVLKLNGDYYNRGWTNVVPDILPVKDDSMEDHLTRLCLQSMSGIKCLILKERLRSNVAIFSKLVELGLYDMDVRELCCVPYPINFLKQLEKLYLSTCENLEGSLFDGKLELCNLKSIDLYKCSMTCLCHPFTAQSLKQLEILHIQYCSGLKYMVAGPMEDHDPNQKSHDSMFPKLTYLEIRSCPELEFILPICFCKDLPLLEHMEIDDCKKLEYVFGQYPDERDLHQMEKEAILQSLEELLIFNVPKFINLYAECYLPCPCFDKVQKSSPSTNVDDCTSSLSRGLLCCFWPKSNASTIYHPFASKNHNKAMKVNYVAHRAHRLFTHPLYPYTLLRKLKLSKLVGLKYLFTLSVASSLKLLKILTIKACDTLGHIVTDKEDDHDHMNVNCIFPNLREVEVFSCRDLEYLFLAFYSKDFKDLESVSINGAEKLTHVFGKCQADQNHNVHIDLKLPAMKRLYLCGIPNFVSICAQNYSMKALYLEDIGLDRRPQFRWKTPREEKGKQLHNLQDLFESKEPKNYMSFQNLSNLTIKRYKQLKFIFSASTSTRLQKLRELEVEDCEELVSIIEDQENNKNPMAPHQVLFPELRTIKVRDCKSMEYLFSISSGKLPRLFYVDIQDTPQLGEVFRWNHGEGQKLVMGNVFPKLCMIRLVNLPTLHTICQGIVDFDTVEFRRVRKCPTLSLTSANDGSEEIRKLQLSLEWNYFFARSLEWNSVHEDVHEDEDIIYQRRITKQWEVEGEEASKEVDEKDSTIQKQESSSPNLTEGINASANEIVEEQLSATLSSNSNVIRDTKTSKTEIVEEQLPTPNAAATPSSKIEEEGSQQDIVNDSTIPQQNNGSPKVENREEVSKDIATEDSTTNINLPNLTKSTKISANEIVEEKLSTTPSSDLDMNLKENFGESPSSEKYSKASSSKLHGKESMDDDQQAHEESRSFNEAPQRIEEPTKEWSSKETSNEVSLNIPPPSITEMTSALEKIMNQPESSTAEQVKFDQGSHQQFAEDDLMRLFQIMEEGVEMEVHMPHVSKIAAVHADNELTKALADLEGSLKMRLNEIASSKESRFRLENALNILSSHCSEHGAPSHGLQTTIHTLQQEIQNILSSSKQAYATIDTYNMLEHKENLFTEERSKRKQAAVALLSEIYNKESSLAEASLKEAEFKEKISKLQAVLERKEKQVQEYEMELISLKEKKKKSVYDTMGFIKEFEALQKERSHMVEENMKAKEHLQNMDVKWSSCLSNLKKTTMLLGIHLQQKL